MKSTFGTAIAIAATTVGIVGSLVTAGSASADAGVEAFNNALSNADMMLPNGSDPVALGQSVCPMLAQPGQTLAIVGTWQQSVKVTPTSYVRP